MQIKQAMAYPFAEGNKVRTLVIPIMLSLLGVIVMMATMALTIFPALSSLQGMSPEKLAQMESSKNLLALLPPTMMPMVLGGFGIGFLGMLLCMLPMSGYTWHLIYHMRTEGFDAPAPAWKGHWGEYFKYGIQAFISGLILAVPLLIAMIPMGALVPFVMASYFLASEEKTVGSVLKNFVPGIQYVAANAGPVLVAFYTAVLISIGYSIASSLLSWTFIGPLVLSMAINITMIYLMTEQFPAMPTGRKNPPDIKPYDEEIEAITNETNDDITRVKMISQNTQNKAFEPGESHAGFVETQLSDMVAQHDVPTASTANPDDPDEPHIEDFVDAPEANAGLLGKGLIQKGIKTPPVYFNAEDNPWLRHRNT